MSRTEIHYVFFLSTLSRPDKHIPVYQILTADAGETKQEWRNPALTPALAASIQVAEALKCCLGRPEVLRGKLLRIDLLEHEHFLINI